MLTVRGADPGRGRDPTGASSGWREGSWVSDTCDHAPVQKLGAQEAAVVGRMLLLQGLVSVRTLLRGHLSSADLLPLGLCKVQVRGHLCQRAYFCP